MLPCTGRDVAQLEPLRVQLRELAKELESRAGEPELMKTEAAERMRKKLEIKLLPKLKTLIPKWAEQLRFMHSDVLKWSRCVAPAVPALVAAMCCQYSIVATSES